MFKFYSCKIRAVNKEEYIYIYIYIYTHTHTHTYIHTHTHTSGFHANRFELAARFLMNLQQVTRIDIFWIENCKVMVLNKA